jgi:hypothetical protein
MAFFSKPRKVDLNFPGLGVGSGSNGTLKETLIRCGNRRESPPAFALSNVHRAQ